MYTLRPYQQTAVNACVCDLNDGINALLSAPTGSGKSIMLGAILLELASAIPKFKACLIIDRENLVSQLTDTFTEMGLQVGTCCASYSKDHDLSKQVTIASRQTLINQMQKMGAVHVVVLDEAHLVPLNPSDSQYVQLIDTFQEYNPNVRLLGCSATPYRLDAGFIHGNAHRADLSPHFTKESYSIKFETLTRQGHLCALNGLVANYRKPDLSNVKITAGEFNLSDLSQEMIKYVDVVRDVIEEHLNERKHILVFATTIDHCEELQAVIPNSKALHSKTKDSKQVLADFKAGEFNVLISVNKLSIGFDFKAASALICARPTMSPSLFVQIVGRILRPHESKENAMFIDLTDNTNTHCPSLDLDKIMVRIPYVPGGGVAPIKFCEAELENGMLCYAENHPSSIFCKECGAKFPEKSIPEEYKPDLKAVAFQAEEPEWYRIASMVISEHTSKKNRKRLIRVAMHTTGLASKTVSSWICTASDYSGFAVQKGRELWSQFTADEMPDDLDTALWIAQESFCVPSRVLCSTTAQGYLNIVSIEFKEQGEFWEEESIEESKSEEVPF